MIPDEPDANIRRIELPPDASVLIIHNGDSATQGQIINGGKGSNQDWSTTFEKTDEQLAEEAAFQRHVNRHNRKSNEFMVMSELQKKALIAIPVGGLALLAIVKLVS